MEYQPFLTINGISHHNNTPEFTGIKWNQNNPGYGLMMKKKDGNNIVGFGFGNYLNSMNRNTNYINGMYEKRLLGGDNFNFSAGVRGGLMTGYALPIVPVIQPMATIGLGRNLDMNIGYQFPVRNMTPEVWTLNFDYRL